MLGVKAAKPPAEVIREHWKARGLEFIGLRMEDGCGLARADFIRPFDLARLQLLAGKGPQGAAYKGSLLSRDGLRWKGGAMSGIRTSTGYVPEQVRRGILLRLHGESLRRWQSGVRTQQARDGCDAGAVAGSRGQAVKDSSRVVRNVTRHLLDLLTRST
jgi:hypothetical protein